MSHTGKTCATATRRTFVLSGLAFVVVGALSISESDGASAFVIFWGIAMIIVGSCTPFFLRLSDRAQIAFAAVTLMFLVALGAVLFLYYFQDFPEAQETQSSHPTNSLENYAEFP